MKLDFAIRMKLQWDLGDEVQECCPDDLEELRQQVFKDIRWAVKEGCAMDVLELEVTAG